jgi:2'-5' RNA ligase
MKRAIHILPALAELASIEAVRRSYDPLAGKIAPHVTLVFPFELGLSADELAAHVSRATGTIKPFEMTFGDAESKENGSYCWLPVVKGMKQIVHMHDRLCTGVLTPGSNTYVYEPHMTVAHVPESKVEEAFRTAKTLKITGAAWVDRVIIERIAADDSSEIENTIMLREN